MTRAEKNICKNAIQFLRMRAFLGQAGMPAQIEQDQGFLSWIAGKINTTVQGAVQWIRDNPDTALRLWQFFTNVPGLPIPPAPAILQPPPEPQPPEQLLGFAPTRGRVRGITRLQPAPQPEFQRPVGFPEPPPPTPVRPMPIPAPTPVTPRIPSPRRTEPAPPPSRFPTRPTPENGPRRPDLGRDRVTRRRIPGTRANGPAPDEPRRTRSQFTGPQPEPENGNGRIVRGGRSRDLSQPVFIPGARRPRERVFQRSRLSQR